MADHGRVGEALAHPLGAWLWALAGGLACAVMMPLEPSLLEEGYLVHIAQRMAAGDVLYRDIVTFTGPFPFELLALLFRIFGEEIEVGRWAVAVLHAISCGAVFALVRRASPGWPAHAAACAMACSPVLLFPLYSMYFYSTLAGALAYMAAYAAMRGLRSAPWAIAAGVLVAFVALTKQTIGVVFALALFTALVAAGRKQAADAPRETAPVRSTASLRPAWMFVAGGAAAAAVTMLAYLVSGDLGAVFRSLVVLPLSLRETFDAPYINVWPPGELAPEIFGKRTFYLPYLYTLLTKDWEDPNPLVVLLTQFLFVLPFLAALGTAVQAARRRLSPAAMIQTAVLVGLGVSLFPRTDWGHLVFVLPASVAQVMILLAPAREARPAVRRVASALPVALVAMLLAGAWSQGRLLHRVTEQGSWGPHVRQRPINRSLRGDQIPAVIRYIRGRTEPGDAIFVARSEPLIYFATDTVNPTPYGGVIPGLQEEQQAAILKGLERVQYVVMSEIDQTFFTFYRDELPEVDAYLQRRFQVAPPFVMKRTWLVVLERGEDRGPTAIDLISPGADVEVRAFVRDQAGIAEAEPRPLPKFPNHHNRTPRPFWIGPLGGGLDYGLVVPEGARLQMSAGVDEFVGLVHGWEQPPHSEVVVSISDGGDFEELFRAPILSSERDAKRWVPVDLDLSRWAGQRVVLRLELWTHVEIEDDMLGWFGSPRIALPAPDSAPGPALGSAPGSVSGTPSEPLSPAGQSVDGAEGGGS